MAIDAGLIDWRAPWFEGWRGPGQRALTTGLPAHEALNLQGGLGAASPVQFVPPQDLPAGSAYEAHVFATGRCPTRDNLHDFFNGLCWLRFPRAKRALNRLQAGEIAAAGVQPVRGALRDALTLFDENGALLQAPAPLWRALRARHWHAAFVDLRPLWQQTRLTVFGHALLEKLVQPRKGLTAHVYLAQGRPNLAAGANDEALDVALAGDLAAAHLAGKPFTPLPVLGVPGWWPANEDLAFYDDAAVFRPAPDDLRVRGHTGPNS